MKYKNKLTGAVLESTCQMGGAWELISETPKKTTKKAPQKKVTKKAKGE
jgi:hypothetical protein